MSLVFYLLAVTCVGRACLGAAASALFGESGLPASSIEVWFRLAAMGWLGLELALSTVFLFAARRPVTEHGAVWGSLGVIVTRLVVDVVGVLSFPPQVALWLLLDLVVHLALFSLWLRAVPDVVKSPEWKR